MTLQSEMRGDDCSVRSSLHRRPASRILIEGRWSTATGIPAPELAEIVRPVIADAEIQYLNDAALWGAPIDDERYVLVARAHPVD